MFSIVIDRIFDLVLCQLKKGSVATSGYLDILHPNHLAQRPAQMLISCRPGSPPSRRPWSGGGGRLREKPAAKKTPVKKAAKKPAAKKAAKK